MKKDVIVDTGPIVAFVNHRDTYHDWITSQVADIQYPLLTCEAVITEACFLLRNFAGKQHTVLEMVHNGYIIVPFHLHDEVAQVNELMAKYADAPMALADACLVRMTEQYPRSTVLTLDSDFHIYRKHGRQSIPCLIPDM